jgi:hypothetical protein
MTVHLDSSGMEAVLKSQPMKRLVSEAAQKIADAVKEQRIEVGPFKGGRDDIPLPVRVQTETTKDRASASVILAHPAGIAVQAKHGALTRAASAVGLEVSGD